MSLPCIKAFWHGEIRAFMRGLSLLTRSLDMILFMTLYRLIGLKFETSSRIGHLVNNKSVESMVKGFKKST